jgi:N-acetylglucosaminyldiphosphoundecaprenol N-acetyl-beta-D-mannosaminyltransferase
MSKQKDFDKLDLLGVEIDAISNRSAIDYIVDRGAAGRASCYVVKPYVEFLDRSYKNEPLQTLLNDAELALPDGVALVWAAAYLYAGKRSFWRFWQTLFKIVLAPDDLRWPLPDRTAGVNFTRPLLEAAAAANLKIFLIGSPAGSEGSKGIGTTADFLSQEIPGLHIVGTLSGRDPSLPSGQVGQSWYDEAASQISSAKPDLILVGMGFPLQERVCAYLAGHVNHGVFLGEGGTFDYAAFGGSLRRAPSWVQRFGLEWLWRLIGQPKRLIRQFAIPRFIYRIWRDR